MNQNVMKTAKHVTEMKNNPYILTLMKEIEMKCRKLNITHTHVTFNINLKFHYFCFLF